MGKKDGLLQNTLRKMRGKAALIVWDILQGSGLLGTMAAVSMAWADSPNKLALACAMILMVVQAIVVHMLINYYYNTSDYTEKMLGGIRKYYDYGYKKPFIEFVENSLQHDMLFNGGQLILTKDLVLSYAESDLYFSPVVILRSEIVEAEFFVRQNFGRRPNSGILRCRLKNGKKVELYTSTGAGGINYMVEQLTKNKFNFHMN